MTHRLASSLGAFALLLASTLVALGICELIVRFAFPPAPTLLGVGLVSSGTYGPDPILGWRPRPNVTYFSPRFSETYTTNSRGLRGPERPLEEPAGLRTA